MSHEASKAVLEAEIKDQALKSVLLGMANHAGPTGKHIYPSVKRLSVYSGLSESTVRAKLAKARELKFINVVRKAYHYRPTEYEMDLNKLIALEHPFIKQLREEDNAIYGGTMASESKRSDCENSDKQTSDSRHQTSSSKKQASSSQHQTSESRRVTIINHHINHQEEPIDSRSNSREKKPPYRKKMNDRLCKYFSELTGIPIPKLETAAQRSKFGTRWTSPIYERMASLDDNEDNVMALFEEAFKRLSKNGMTISSPLSLANTCDAIIGEVKRGAYKPSYSFESEMQKFMDWSAREVQSGER